MEKASELVFTTKDVDGFPDGWPLVLRCRWDGSKQLELFATRIQETGIELIVLMAPNPEIFSKHVRVKNIPNAFNQYPYLIQGVR